MDKKVRNAVRCFVIKDGKVLVTRYKPGNKKEGFLEIPGGKIEENETPKQTAVREVKEETNIDLNEENLIYKGKIKVEYPDRIFILETFITDKYLGNIKDTEENYTYFMDIEDVRKEQKVLSNLMILDRFYIKCLIDENYNFDMEIIVDEDENILETKYKLIKL